MPHLAARSIARSLVRRHVVVLGLIAIGVTIALALQMLAADRFDAAIRMSNLAARQPSLVARAVTLATVVVDEDGSEGARLVARRDLEILLSRLEAAHDAMVLTASAASAERNAVVRPRDLVLLDEVDAPLRAYIANGRALVTLSELSPAGATRRLRAMRHMEPTRLAAQLDRIAELRDAQQRNMVRQNVRTQTAVWATLLCLIAGLGVFVLHPTVARVTTLLWDAQSRAKLAQALRRARTAQFEGAPLSSGETDDDEADDELDDESSAPPSPELSGRVLIAITDAATRAATHDFLCARGLTVDTVASGGEAVDLARSKAFDLVVLDAGLAETSVRAVKAAAAPAPTPCLALAARTDAETRERLRAAGADMLASLPLHAREIDAVLAFALARRAPQIPRAKRSAAA